MKVKRGDIILNTAVKSWGAGKVLDVADLNATIQFSDGVTRKIASSHYHILEATDHAAFITTSEKSTSVAKPSAPVARKVKTSKPALGMIKQN
jgi:hypothetical protein